MALTELYIYVCDASNQRHITGPRFLKAYSYCQCFLYADFIVAVRHGKISSATLSEIGQTHNSRGCLLNDPADITQFNNK